MPDIDYHGVFTELPNTAVERVIRQDYTRLVRCDRVMFFRPIGQVAFLLPDDEPESGPERPEEIAPAESEPVVALFDGLPLENHQWLAGRLRVDDPDNWSASYPAVERVHGTAMASLILHGDMEAGGKALPRPIYVRPIMKPETGNWLQPQQRRESVPEDLVPTDLMQSAVRRLFERSGGSPPIAPGVRIINLAVCDIARPLDRFPSPWARMLDWLAWRYRVLFVVSAGNYPDDLILDAPHDDLTSLPPDQVITKTIGAIARDAHQRRILSPSESVNALTVAAMHSDASTSGSGSLIDVFRDRALPSPINALGPGFRRSVKPDILMPGGRQLYRKKLGTFEQATLEIPRAGGSGPPGQRVATPGWMPGDISASRYVRGTSNAAALTTRLAARLYEMLQDLRRESGAGVLVDAYDAVILKALLVHGAAWGDARQVLEDARVGSSDPRHCREQVARFLGFGAADGERALACTDQRATLLGCGALEQDQAHEFNVPLPPSLAGTKVWRRLTITLAWLTPTAPRHGHYRTAALWFDSPKDDEADKSEVAKYLKVKRQDVDWLAVRRGTVQHELLEGDQATVFTDGTMLRVRVNCRPDAAALSLPVPYGLAVTLEVAEGTAIPVYEEIRTRLRVPVRVTAAGGSPHLPSSNLRQTSFDQADD